MDTLLTCILIDLIIVFNNGEVVEQGTHQELLQKGGLYYDMWLEQAVDAFTEGEKDESEERDGEAAADNAVEEAMERSEQRR